MNQDERASQLSAMFDGELPAAECELLSRRLARDEQLRATWSRYSVIGAALRAEPLAQVRPDFAHRVSAALSAGASAAGSERARVRVRGGRLLRGAALGSAVAAGVAGVAIMMLRNGLPVQEIAAAPAAARAAAPVQVASASLRLVAPAAANSGNELASYTVPPLSNDNNMALQGSLADYVIAHSEYSSPLSRGSLLSDLVGNERVQPAPAAPAAAVRAATRLATAPAAQAAPTSDAPAPADGSNSHRLSAAFAAAALAASFASLADDARGLLQRMERALASRNYQGTFVHEHDGQTETLRIVHRAEGGGFAERLVSLDGSGREVIRRDGELRAYFPDQRAVLVESDPNAGLLLTGLQGLDSAGQMYRLSEESRMRISGREARVLVVEPQDDLRYGYRVWIDESSAMPLKTQLTTAGGRVVEQLVFTDLSLPARVADSALQPAFSARDFRLLRQGAAAASAPRQAADTTWDAADLPPGFRLVAHSTRMMGDNQRTVTHLVFSDGLASVSVFVEPRTRASDSTPAALAPPAETRLGSSSAVSTEVDGHRVTAIGEVPPATVRAIAGSLRSGFAPSARGSAGAGPHR